MGALIPPSSERSIGCWKCCLFVCAALPALGCGDGRDGHQASGVQALVVASKWEAVDEADDPFIDDKADGAECDSLGYSVEDYESEQAFFVDTQACDYLTVEQPALVGVGEGDTLHLRLYHYDLTAPDGGQAHLAIVLGEDTVWEKELDIPRDAKLFDTTWQADADLVAGDPVLFHVSNHGDNNYALIELSKMN